MKYRLNRVAEKLKSRLKDYPEIMRLRRAIVSMERSAERHNELLRVSRDLRADLRRNSESLRWIAEHTGTYQHAPTRENIVQPQPLVSIIIPTWNRAPLLARALESIRAQTYSNWECLIVDDGSTDNTQQVVTPFLTDARFRYFPQPHRGGCAAARNYALEKSRGEIITYLDSDNRWLSHYLMEVARAFGADADLQFAYCAQIIENTNTNFCYVRYAPFDYAHLQKENYIDQNVIAHRRGLVESYGGFDESLESLMDWDLALRYTAHEKTRAFPFIGGYYYYGHNDQLVANAPAEADRYRIEMKLSPPVIEKLKVLYAVWHYPQLSESYIRTEIVGALENGVEIEVWAEEESAAGFDSEVKVHRGSLRDAIESFRPDVVHTHWLNIARQYAPIVAEFGLPLTVRGHGFEFTPELARELAASEIVKGIFLFPHQAGSVPPDAKIHAMPVLFNASLYQPQPDKDRHLVLRAGCALPSKDYQTFLRAAQLCPDHQFKLVLCHALKKEAYLDEVIALNAQMGNPAEILVDLQHEELAELMRRAAIYLHTVHLSGRAATPFGMPISISEALATGCHIVYRDLPAAAEYVGAAGAAYHTPEDAAARVRATAAWSTEKWHKTYLDAVNQAYGNYAARRTIVPLLNCWQELQRETQTPAPKTNRRLAGATL